MSTKNAFGALAVLLGAMMGLEGCGTEGDGDDLAFTEQNADLPPVVLTVTAVSTVREDLTWPDAAGATGYIVYRAIGVVDTPTTFTSAGPSPFIYGHLAPNTTYCWQVAYLVAGNQLSPRSNKACASTADAPLPGVPQNVVATAVSSSRILVTWDPVATATTYQVFGGIPPAPLSFLATVSAPRVTFVAAGLAAGTTYAFEVRAVTPIGTSPPSTPVATATTFALGLEAYYKFDDPRTGTVASDVSGLSRTGSLSGGAVLAGDKPNVLNNGSALSIPTASTANMTVANAPAFNFTSPFSVAAWIRIPAAVDVRIVGMRVPGCGQLGWEIGQNGPNQLYFASRTRLLSFGSAVADQWTHVAATFDNVNLTLYLNGAQVQSSAFVVNNGIKQPMTIGHVGDCAGGAVLLDELQIYSRVLGANEIAKMGTLPPAPQNLVATVVSSTQTDLTWNPVSGATGYLIYLGTASGEETFLTHAGPGAAPSSPSFSYGHLLPATQYFWRVAAAVPPLFSLPSSEAEGTTVPPPDPPGNVVATTVSSSRIQIDWDNVPGATSYRVYVQNPADQSFTFLATVVAPTKTFRAANLTPNTTYTFELTAVDAGLAVSPFSAPATATTDP